MEKKNYTTPTLRVAILHNDVITSSSIAESNFDLDWAGFYEEDIGQ